MAIRMNYSFIKGCGKVCKEDYSKLNTELKEYLGCKTMTHYYLKRKRFIDMPVHIKEGIEAIFSKYNVSPEEIWEITPVAEQP